MIRWVVVAGIIAACLGYLIYSATGASAEYYESISQMRAHPPTRAVRVLGTIQNDIHYSNGGRTVHFSAAQGQDTLAIDYTGQLPEIFKPGIQVVVDGRPGPDGTFHATSLQTKCPSKFTAASPAPA